MPRAVGYSEVTQITGLSASDPLGRSRTCPVAPSDSVVETILAPPLSVHPSPLKLSLVSPVIDVYQLVSLA